MAEADGSGARDAGDAAPLPVTPGEMAEGTRRAGLEIDAAQCADLERSWRQIVALAARIPRGRPFVDDLTGVGARRPPAEAAK